MGRDVPVLGKHITPGRSEPECRSKSLESDRGRDGVTPCSNWQRHQISRGQIVRCVGILFTGKECQDDEAVWLRKERVFRILTTWMIPRTRSIVSEANLVSRPTAACFRPQRRKDQRECLATTWKQSTCTELRGRSGRVAPVVASAQMAGIGIKYIGNTKEILCWAWRNPKTDLPLQGRID